MGFVITALLVLSVAAVVGFGVALAVRSRIEFASQNEIVPGRRSPAPASWAGAHSREAKLHRRLGDAVTGARNDPRIAELGLATQMASLESEAMAIDERLVAAASLPAAHRDAAIDPLETHVVELEAAVAEMITSITVADSQEQLDAAVSAADIRLAALAAARAEVEAIDRQVAGTGTVADEIRRASGSAPDETRSAPPAPTTNPPTTEPPPPSPPT